MKPRQRDEFINSAIFVVGSIAMLVGFSADRAAQLAADRDLVTARSQENARAAIYAARDSFDRHATAATAAAFADLPRIVDGTLVVGVFNHDRHALATHTSHIVPLAGGFVGLPHDAGATLAQRIADASRRGNRVGYLDAGTMRDVRLMADELRSDTPSTTIDGLERANKLIDDQLRRVGHYTVVDREMAVTELDPQAIARLCATLDPRQTRAHWQAELTPSPTPTPALGLERQ